MGSACFKPEQDVPLTRAVAIPKESPDFIKPVARRVACSGPYLLDMPDDVLHKTTSYLAAHDLDNVARTCKHLRDIVYTNDAWVTLLQKECNFPSFVNWAVEDPKTAFHACSRVLYARHKITSSDTLEGLALLYHVSTATIKQHNLIFESRVLQQRAFVFIPLSTALLTYLGSAFPEAAFTVTTHSQRNLRKQMLILTVPHSEHPNPISALLQASTNNDTPVACPPLAPIDPPLTPEQQHAKNRKLAEFYKSLFGGNVDMASAYLALANGDVRQAHKLHTEDNRWEKECPGQASRSVVNLSQPAPQPTLSKVPVSKAVKISS